MNLPALILAVLAVILFVCAYLAVPRKWAKTELGLACLALAWIVESVFVGLHVYSIH